MKPILVLLAVFPLAASKAPPTAFFPAGVKVVFGLEVGRLAAAAAVGEEIRGASALLAQTPLAGIDPVKDIEEVLFASTGAGDKAPAIVVLHGAFHLTVPPDGIRYRDVPLLEDPKHPEAVLALIDAETVIAGAPEQVRAAIDRVQAGAETALPANWLDRIEALRNQYAVWGFGEGLEPGPASASSPAKPGDLSSIDHFQFGASLDHGLRLNGEAHLRTARDAEQLRGMLQLFHAMMLQGPKKADGVSFDLSLEESAIRLSLVIPEAELKKTMKEQRSTFVRAMASGMPSRMPSLMPLAVADPPVAASAKPVTPMPSEGKIYTDSTGDTISVTLPVIKREQ